MLKKDTIAYLPSSILPTLIGLGVMPLYTRYFNTEQYGAYIIILTLYSLIQSLSSAWLGSTTIRYNEKYTLESEGEKFYYTVIILSAIICLSLSILTSLLSIFFWKNYNAEFLSMIYLLPLFSLFTTQLELHLQFLRAERKIKTYNIFYIGKVLFVPILVFILHLFTQSVNVIIISGILCNSILILFLYRGNVLRFRIDRVILKKVIVFGLPLAPTFFSSQLINFSERIILTYFEGTEAVGIYGSAQMFSKNPVDLLIAILTISSGPLIVKLWENNSTKELESFLGRLIVYFLAAMFPCLIFLHFYSYNILKLFVSQDFQIGYEVMPYIFLGGCLLGIQWVYQRSLMLSERTNIIMVGFILSIISNIFFGIILIRVYGMKGVAIANILSGLVVLLYIYIQSKKDFSIHLRKNHLLQIVAASLTIYIINYIGTTFNSNTNLWWIILLIAVSSLIYLLILKKGGLVHLKYKSSE